MFFIFVFNCTDCSSLFPQYIVKCQQFLRSVPIPLRLEVLENIFSLLFVSYNDLYTETPLPEDYAEDEDLDKKSAALSVEGGASQRSSTSQSPQHLTEAEKKSEKHLLAAQTVHTDPRDLCDSILDGKSCETSKPSYLDLKHFTSGVTGFLVDDVAMEAFLTFLLSHLEEIQSSLPWDSSNVLREELELVECLNLSASRDAFGSRVLQFSKYLSEAHWRYKVVMSNRNAGGLCIWPFLVCYSCPNSHLKAKFHEHVTEGAHFGRYRENDLLRDYLVLAPFSNRSDLCSNQKVWVFFLSLLYYSG